MSGFRLVVGVLLTVVLSSPALAQSAKAMGTVRDTNGKPIKGATVKAVNSPDTRQQLTQIGADPAPNTPEEFGRFVRQEYERYGKLIREAGIKLE